MRNGLAMVPKNAADRNLCQYLALTPFWSPDALRRCYGDCETCDRKHSTTVGVAVLLSKICWNCR
jgi:hypothetical protein